MYQQLNSPLPHILSFRISGEITRREGRELDRIIGGAIAAHGRIRVILTLKGYETFNSAEAIYEDLSVIKRHAEGIQKLCVLGDRAWENTWIALFGLFGGLQAAYFSTKEYMAAWEWVSS